MTTANNIIFLPIQEIIPFTIQGEGYFTGIASSFIRLFGCPVNCHFCDSGYSKLEKSPDHQDLSFEFILKQLQCDRVVITGGEPFIYKEKLSSLINYLIQDDRQISIETSGIIHYNIPDSVWVTLSPKEHVNNRAIVDPCLRERANELKIVVTSADTIGHYQVMIGDFINQSKPVYLQPEWSKQDEVLPIILDYLKSNPQTKLSIQTHKYLNLP